MTRETKQNRRTRGRPKREREREKMRRRIIKCWFMAIWTRLRVVARHFRRSSRASASCVRSWPSVTLIYSSSHPPPSRPSSSSSLSSSGLAEVCCLWKLVANLGLSSLSCVVQTFVRLDAAGKLSKREREIASDQAQDRWRSPWDHLGSPHRLDCAETCI